MQIKTEAMDMPVATWYRAKDCPAMYGVCMKRGKPHGKVSSRCSFYLPFYKLPSGDMGEWCNFGEEAA